MITSLSLQDVPFEMVDRQAPLFLCTTSAGFPSPAQDDMEERSTLSPSPPLPNLEAVILPLSGSGRTMSPDARRHGHHQAHPADNL
jgi:hypothetical protein